MGREDDAGNWPGVASGPLWEDSEVGFAHADQRPGQWHSQQSSLLWGKSMGRTA